MTGIIDQAAQVLSSSNVDRGFVSDIISPKLYTSISKAKQKKKKKKKKKRHRSYKWRTTPSAARKSKSFALKNSSG
jgi:hypothetical protein